MQPNASSSSGGEDKLLAFGLILAVLAGGGWYLWYKYHAQIAAAVMAVQHWKMVQFSIVTDAYADLDRQVLATGRVPDVDDMLDRSSRPRCSPTRLDRRTEHRILGLRITRRWGPARIGYHLGLRPSTVHKVLTRYRCPRLKWIDPATGVLRGGTESRKDGVALGW